MFASLSTAASSPPKNSPCHYFIIILFRGGGGCTQASAAFIHGRKLGTMFWCARKLKSSLLRQTLTLILVEEWTSHAFIAGTKKFLPLSGKNSFTTYNRRKVANDAFYANHSQKQVGTDPFFNEKFNFSLVSKKRSLEQRTFAAFIRDTI